MPLIGTRGAASSRGYGRFGGASLIYPFTSFTFTNAGASGPYGPTLSQCQSAYSSTAWTQNTAYFNMTTQGYQLWTVPGSGTYQFDLRGADGATGSGSGTAGRGITISLRTTLVSAEVIKIVVGQHGQNSNEHGGGGGATYVVRTPYNTDASIIAIAAGGGGRRTGSSGAGWDAWQYNYGSADATNSSASPTSQVNNTTSGSGYTPSTTSLGQGGCGANSNFGDGGGGFYGNGYDDGGGSTSVAYSFQNGCQGGYSGSNSAHGGFGGGGHGAGGNGGGGGGGYTGGNGGFTAGGGGSWVISGASNVNYSLTGSQPYDGNGSHGYCTVTYLG